jgi:hypothetical protein
VEIFRNGTDNGTLSGSKITVSTSANDTIDLAPAGTSLATIQSELTQPMQNGGGGTTTSFSTGLESGNPMPTWTDTVDPTAGATSVTGLCCGLTGPQAGVRTGETSHAGSAALMYSGSAQGGNPHAYLEVFDLSGSPLAIGTSKTLSYWIYPQDNATTPYVAAGSTNSTCAAVDMYFTDGSTLRDSGAVDQNGNKIHPASQCGHLSLNTWNHVTVNLATNNGNKQISRILIGYDQPGATGGYRGYVDDITIN